MVGLAKKLEGQKAMFSPVEESLDEESVAVEAYNTVLVALVTAQARMPRRRSPRLQQHDSVAAEAHSSSCGQQAAGDNADLIDAELDEEEEEEEAAVPTTQPAGDEQPAASAGLNVVPPPQEDPLLQIEVVKQMQQEQPMMKALAAYITDHKLPADRLQRIRVLEAAPMYEVNQAGLLCRVRSRGDKGSLGVDLQVVVPETLHGTVIAGCHQGAEGHASVLKTFQKVRDRFYWPGMFLDVQRYVKFCTGCQLNAQVRGKAHITKHIEASAPGETVVIDLLHFPTAKGYRYVLVAVDAFSRWAEAVAIADKSAATVADAFIASVLTNTAGALKLVVSDQGSEFKGDLASAMQLLKVQQKYTAAYRSEGHGLAERYNRGLADTLKSMVSQEEPDWHRALPWAKLAYNTAVHRALSDASEGLSPAEVHLGRRLHINAEAGMAAWSAAEGPRTASKYVEDLGKHVEAVTQWVRQCREKYNKQMRTQANKAGRSVREFEVGQSVRLQDTARKGTRRKLMRLYDGPYQILERCNDNEYTVQKLGEGKRIKFRVHTDRLAPYNDLMEMDVRRTPAAHDRAGSDMEEFEVEQIVDDTGSRANGNKKYLIRWAGYGPQDDTWESIDNLVHCADKVQDYELRQVGVHAVHDCDWDGTAGVGIFAVHSVGDNGRAITLTMDLNGTETPAQLLQHICKEAKIKQEDIVLAWASPPCETFSRANASNISRGHHYRVLQEPVEGAKGDVARQHDRLVQRVKQVLTIIGTFVMENPACGLEKMWYMLDWQNKKKVIELCAFAWPFKKTTNLWTQGLQWQPTGNTSDGRCNEACGQGSVNPLTRRFKHFMALAVDPQRGPRGEQATRMTCGIPTMLIQEILHAMAERQSLGGKVVLDLCSGFQSIRQAVLQTGATYVAVDVKGNRFKEPSQPRRAAAVVCSGGSVLAVEYKHTAGTSHWTIPGGDKDSADPSLHHAALRELRGMTGLDLAELTDKVRVGPELIALSETTYFAFALDPDLSQAKLSSSFARRREPEKIRRMAWISEEQAAQLQWRSEDRQMLDRIWGQPPHSCMSKQMSGGC